MAAAGIAYGVLKKRCLGNAVLAAELLALFDRSVLADSAAVRAALEAGDEAAAKAVIHRMKSAAGTAAAERLHGMLVEMERAPTLAGWAAVADEIDACRQSIAHPPV